MDSEEDRGLMDLARAAVVGLVVNVPPANGSGAFRWWVRITEVSPCGNFVRVKADGAAAGKHAAAFGKPRWVDVRVVSARRQSVRDAVERLVGMVDAVREEKRREVIAAKLCKGGAVGGGRRRIRMDDLEA